MDLAATHNVVHQAETLKANGQSLTAEAEELWTEVQELVQAKASPEDVKLKVDRLKEIRAMMSSTASEFISLVNMHPRLVSFLNESGASPAVAPTLLGAGGVDAGARRKSRLSAVPLQACGDAYTAMGGRAVSLSTNSDLLGELECIMLEPQGKRLAPQDYVTTGVVICLQGMPPSEASVKEWCEAANSANWLQHGATVVVPNIQAASALAASDIADVVDAVCEQVGFDRVLLVGKDLMALRMLELAAEELLEDRDRELCGIILLGPSSPVPSAIEKTTVPVMLLWAKDDDISPFDESEPWLDALGRESEGPLSTVKTCEAGGHDFAKVLGIGGAASAVSSFFVTIFIIADLLAEEGGKWSGNVEKAASRVENLTTALPPGIKEACSGAPGSMLDMQSEANKRRMTATLVNWIQGGLEVTRD